MCRASRSTTGAIAIAANQAISTVKMHAAAVPDDELENEAQRDHGQHHETDSPDVPWPECDLSGLLSHCRRIPLPFAPPCAE